MSATATPAPLVSLTWTDHVTGREGHLVIDRLCRGRARGDARRRAGLRHHGRLLRAPDPDTARATLAPYRYADIEVHNWQFGGRAVTPPA